MEKIWYEYFTLDKEKRNGIQWENEILRPAEFDDKYLLQCKQECKTPIKEIYDHFWKNCVDI